ncbi:uncharacterized protein C8A04DRAFT_11823 [Dichotomopilus funicola]|uniref:RNA polymerase II assembly factor Rtp1 C-terminal domain-containing protein n=1 Tax=Dichotomopilus funicola TaxID=1934379 RepID=A0AAN6V3M0_9PEZI|nr:hypothetical protein C8A04DRAFT_11823 [Dichotomopilus funicola]
MDKLARLPSERPQDGVRATLEFVFSMHPSSTMMSVAAAEAAVPQKKGALITHEALTLASNLLSKPPKAVSPETWYAGISPQLLGLLDGGEGPELVKAAAYVIGFGILGTKEFGAPGTAGWKFFAEPMLHHIKPPPGASKDSVVDADGVINLSRGQIVVSPENLVTALRRLQSLVVAHPNPGLCKRLLTPLLLPLWALASWPDAKETACEPALSLMKIFLQITASPNLVATLIRNLGYLGGYDKQNPEWVYDGVNGGQIAIVDLRRALRASAPPIIPQGIDQKISKLFEVITLTYSDGDLSTIFLQLLKKWLKSTADSKGLGIKIEQADEEDAVTQLTEMKTLRAMMEKFPEKLAAQPKHILDLAAQLLAAPGEALDGNDEVTGVTLSLLNMVITAPGFQKSHVDPETLRLIESSLDTLSRSSTDASPTATNLRLLLLYRDEIDPDAPTTTAPTDRQVEDRKAYNLAVSYITAADSPPPVRSEGLNLISKLVAARSPALDIPGILVLLATLIADSDEYIYLRIIKLYTLLCNGHPRSVLRDLTDHFVDAKEKHAVDTRLRFGEAILQVIQRMGETFTGGLAEETGHGLLSVAGRRGHRPKTEARQARDTKTQERKEKEAEEAWGGEMPDMSDTMTAEEKLRNEVLEQIVQGWESQRGMEDVRVRTSALSVLGAAVEVNVAGLGQQVVTAAVDLSVAVLQLEREVEKGILRRAAAAFVLSFLNALQKADESGQGLGFGFGPRAQEDVLRTLRYVVDTDEDGLVVEHAREAVAGLEEWQAIKLLPIGRNQQLVFGGGLTRLAGLDINPERSAAATSAAENPTRVRIEEIE